MKRDKGLVLARAQVSTGNETSRYLYHMHMVPSMNVTSLLSAIETEIARLKQARALLASDQPYKRRGRPPGSTNKNSVVSQAPTLVAPKKRTMSAAGRKRIAEAQRKRWAAQKKAALKAA
jgi:hypothetical protein